MTNHVNSLLVENFLFENFLYVQVSIQTLKKVFMVVWKCEYCLLWILNKSVLFGSNSESVIIVWYVLWKNFLL